MRKYLGLLAGMAALCAMTWAQSPSQAPTPPAADQTQAPAPATNDAPAPAQAQPTTQDQPQAPPPAATPIPNAPTPAANSNAEVQYPRLELFVGGSYAEAGLFNAGHWAGLPGWDASFGLNVTSWIGLIVDGGQYFGTSKIPTEVPAPFPTCPPFCPGTSPTFDVDTREYNILFGVQFARRKYKAWTPIAEVMYGHQGTRGQVNSDTPGSTISAVGSGRAIIVGGGFDRRINERFALRFKADYFQTATDFPMQPKQTQDNFRFSVGIVIRNVHKKKRTLEDETQPAP